LSLVDHGEKLAYVVGSAEDVVGVGDIEDVENFVDIEGVEVVAYSGVACSVVACSVVACSVVAYYVAAYYVAAYCVVVTLVGTQIVVVERGEDAYVEGVGDEKVENVEDVVVGVVGEVAEGVGGAEGVAEGAEGVEDVGGGNVGTEESLTFAFGVAAAEVGAYVAIVGGVVVLAFAAHVVAATAKGVGPWGQGTEGMAQTGAGTLRIVVRAWLPIPPRITFWEPLALDVPLALDTLLVLVLVLVDGDTSLSLTDNCHEHQLVHY
jgi:hypothetical protein